MPDKALVHRLDHLLPQVVNGRGDLFQIAHPGHFGKCAKQEIDMSSIDCGLPPSVQGFGQGPVLTAILKI